MGGRDSLGNYTRKKVIFDSERLVDKYEKHVCDRHEFEDISKEEFDKEARNLANRKPKKTVEEFLRREDGMTVRYDNRTNEIIFQKDEGIESFFKPKDGKVYFERLFNKEMKKRGEDGRE